MGMVINVDEGKGEGEFLPKTAMANSYLLLTPHALLAETAETLALLSKWEFWSDVGRVCAHSQRVTCEIENNPRV